MFEFTIRQARCFDEPAPIRVRPLTFFVGENSSGKTSALALLYSLLSSSRSGRLNFNADPFSLGAFDQIAHFRGGRAGRAKEFRLCISTPSTGNRRGTKQPSLFSDDAPRHSTYTATFGSRSERPHLARHQFDTDLGTISVDTPVTGTPALLVKSAAEDRSRELPLLPISQRLLSDFGIFAFSRVLQDQRFFLQQTEQGNAQDTTLLQSIHPEFRRFLQSLPDTIFASAPVRSKPERTYNPGDEGASPQGAHVPFSIARMHKDSAEDWHELRRFMEAFGRASGLFDTIEVKRFGKTLSDPFQIQLKIKGPKVNIVDTGYGVSQVIPILFHIHSRERNSMLMLQQPEVHLHPRAQAALGDIFCATVAGRANYLVVETHSDFIIDRVRRAVRRGRISPSQVSIVFFAHTDFHSSIHNIELDESGTPIDPPNEYREFFLKEELDNLS